MAKHEYLFFSTVLGFATYILSTHAMTPWLHAMPRYDVCLPSVRPSAINRESRHSEDRPFLGNTETTLRWKCWSWNAHRLRLCTYLRGIILPNCRQKVNIYIKCTVYGIQVHASYIAGGCKMNQNVTTHSQTDPITLSSKWSMKKHSNNMCISSLHAIQSLSINNPPNK